MKRRTIEGECAMTLSQLLDIRPGVTAVIGGGGKTTLLRTLGEELAGQHPVLLCTTTKILPFSDLPCARTAAELDQQRRSHRLMCAGSPVADAGKLTAPSVPLEMLTAWFDYILVEADGAAGRPLKAHAPHEPGIPLKAHAPHEPVIPTEANQTICVVGASGFGRPIAAAAHRPERYALLAGVPEAAEATPEAEARVLRSEDLHTKVYVNQVETLWNLADARALARLMDCPVLAGSLWRREYFPCW